MPHNRNALGGPRAEQRIGRRLVIAALAAGVALAAAGVAMFSSFQPFTTRAAPRPVAAPTVYYVDSAAGNDKNAGTSESAPWRSLAKVNATDLFPGDKVLFKGGSSWTGSLMINDSGTADQPIIIGAYGSGWPRIDGKRSANSTVTVSNASYVTVADLEVTNSTDISAPADTYYRGIYLTARNSGKIEGDVVYGNYVHDVDGFGGSDGFGSGGIAIGVRGNTTPTWFDGLNISGNEVSNINDFGISMFTTWCGCEISPETGVPQRETSSLRKPFTGLTIDHNFVHDVTGGGIVPESADGALVEWNTVNRAASNQLDAWGGNVGIYWGNSDGITVQYNTVQQTAVGGIYPNADGLAFDADMNTSNSIVQYNISVGNNGGFFLCEANSNDSQVRYNISVADKRMIFRFLSGCNNTRAYNNTIWGTTEETPTLIGPGVPGPSKPMVGIIASDDPDDFWNVTGGHTLTDNIFYNPANLAYNLDGMEPSDYSHNLYWNGTADTLAANDDPAPIIGDPLLADPTVSLPTDRLITADDFYAFASGFTPTASSPARGAGISEWGESEGTDILGATVPNGAVDVGAVQTETGAEAGAEPGTLQGLVTADGAPLAGMTVYLFDKSASEADGALAATTTNADGFYWFPGIDAVDYDVAVGDGGHDWTTQWLAATVPAGGSVAANAEMIAIPEADTVQGIVSGPQGVLSGITVYLYAHGDTSHALAATTTNADGFYWFLNQPVGSYDIAFSDGGVRWVTEWFDEADGATSQSEALPVTVGAGTWIDANATLAETGL